MKNARFGLAVLASGLLMAAPAFAQTSGSSSNQNGTVQQSPTTAQKQKTQSDPTNSYLFKPGSGDYSPRSAQKQRTDGEDVTGNNNFPAASK